MESVVLITDRPELRQALRRALGPAPPFRTYSSAEWKRGEFGATRDRVFVVDLPGARFVREHLAVAENWPHGFAGHLLAVLSSDAVGSFQPHASVDDILVEPFSDAEASLRIRNLLWRTRNSAPPEVMAFGILRIDTVRYEVTLDNEVLDLTFKEYELLRFLAANPGRVFTRDLLLSRVWGEDYYGGTRTVDVHIRRIRVKLGSEYETCIGTVRNVGYRFQMPGDDE